MLFQRISCFTFRYSTRAFDEGFGWRIACDMDYQLTNWMSPLGAGIAHSTNRAISYGAQPDTRRLAIDGATSVVQLTALPS